MEVIELDQQLLVEEGPIGEVDEGLSWESKCCPTASPWLDVSVPQVDAGRVFAMGHPSIVDS